MKKDKLIILLFLSLQLLLKAQGNGYFIGFTDKEGTNYSINKPEEFLSARALERRQKQNIAITVEDLPVSQVYVDSLKQLGISVKYKVKWLNGVIAFSDDVDLMDTLARVSFVNLVDFTLPDIRLKSAYNKFNLQQSHEANELSVNSDYGEAKLQIYSSNTHKLHQEGYKGEGLHIAVIDAGFTGINDVDYLHKLHEEGRILGTYNFPDGTDNVDLDGTHGTRVLSVMAGDIEGEYIGAAPKASYWLLKTEVTNYEYPIEPDYWMVAAEYADSVGADVINTSLGYTRFDNEQLNYTYSDMTGENTRISRAAQLASNKGMLVSVAAGNEGLWDWKYIVAPADAKDVLTVGGADMLIDTVQFLFSSWGPTFDQRLKPEVCALGENVAVPVDNHTIGYDSGTSLATPLIAGAAACLWQKFPELTALELKDMIVKSGHHYDNPTFDMGYGIPNFDFSSSTGLYSHEMNRAEVNAVFSGNELYVKAGQTIKAIAIHDAGGRLVYNEKLLVEASELHLKACNRLYPGVYILSCEYENGVSSCKVLKY